MWVRLTACLQTSASWLRRPGVSDVREAASVWDASHAPTHASQGALPRAPVARVGPAKIWVGGG